MAALKDIKRKISRRSENETDHQGDEHGGRLEVQGGPDTDGKLPGPMPGSLWKYLDGFALRVDAEAHPLLAVREPKRIRVICMTSDRGLCGGFNNNLIKATERFIREKQSKGLEVSLIPIDRKGRDYFRKKATVIDARTDVFGKFDMKLAVQISGDVIRLFVAEEYDELYLLYNEFVNVAVHRPSVVRLFPLPSVGRKKDRAGENGATHLRTLRRCPPGEAASPVRTHPDLPGARGNVRRGNHQDRDDRQRHPELRRDDPEPDAQIQQGETIGDHRRADGHRGRD